ncbi:phage tail protein [Streptomyces mobaraensis]|uniref:phage tail protein n=1 Tax=Streptomyces mobaraensis TaxID=35621 RepID=UPI0033F5FF04
MAVGDTVSGFTFGIELGKFRVETVQQISDLNIGQELMDIGHAMPGTLLTAKQPGPLRPGEVTITRGLDRSKEFTDWIAKSMAGQGDVREDISISVMDHQEKPIKRIQLSRAWASDWQGPGHEPGSNGPATEVVTVTYEGIKIGSV